MDTWKELLGFTSKPEQSATKDLRGFRTEIESRILSLSALVDESRKVQPNTR